MNVLYGLASKIFCVGCVLFILNTAAGDRTEGLPVKIGCAALSVIFCISLFSAKLELTNDLFDKSTVEKSVGSAIEEFDSERLESAARAVERFVEETAASYGHTCNCFAEYEIRQGKFYIKRLTISGFPEEKQSLLSDELERSISPEIITYGDIK